ncbi:MAG: photosynthetic complex putative assembly protein PuhB [Pseudomonadota bacterium]
MEREFHDEPVRGLPEELPSGEAILWQGAPRVWALAVQALGLPYVAAGFVAVFAWQVGLGLRSADLITAMGNASFFLWLGGFACALIFVVAFVQARATIYTITNRRVALRIGTAMTLTFNLPYSRIAAAHLARGPGGTGTVTLTPAPGGADLSYLLLWPHVRPWQTRPVEPALRCIADAERVAALLAEAAEDCLAMPQVARTEQRIAAE